MCHKNLEGVGKLFPAIKPNTTHTSVNISNNNCGYSTLYICGDEFIFQPSSFDEILRNIIRNNRELEGMMENVFLKFGKRKKKGISFSVLSFY